MQQKNDTQVSSYRNTRDTNGTIQTITAIVEQMRTSSHGLIAKTKKARKLAASGQKDNYRKYKASYLPAITPAGTFRKRNAEELKDYSGFAVIDINGLHPEQLHAIRAMITALPFVVLVFVSPSGAGLKVFVRVSPVSVNAKSHTEWTFN
jgi:flagellar basal body rod protein FlgG